MANSRLLRQEARSLLEAAKLAFRFIQSNEVGLAEEREEVLNSLREVIDRADPPTLDDSLTVQLVMTNSTGEAIREMLTSCAAQEPELVEFVCSGMRVTKQRTYLRLDLVPELLHRFCFFLEHRNTARRHDSFKRLAKEIKAGMNQNPMEILGKLGL